MGVSKMRRSRAKRREEMMGGEGAYYAT